MSKLFSADGIRGVVYEPPLLQEDIERLSYALAVWLRSQESSPYFLIGTDTRESNQHLKSVLVDGLSRGGVRVVDVGIVPTAAISYLIISEGYFAGGAMISASHNPIIENGIKLFDHQGVKISNEAECLIETLFYSNTLYSFSTRPVAVISRPDLVQRYTQALIEEVQTDRPIQSRIVIDCAHGAASQIAPLVLGALNIPHAVLNISPDGTNINRYAGSEYIRFNPHVLAREIQRCEADFGVALDGDADRVVFIDNTGRLYDGDMILAMLSLKLQAEGRLQQNTIVVTPMSNSGLGHYLQQHGITTRVVQNGDKYITRTLIDDDLTLGGEEIGHIIARTDKLHITGDGLRTALLVLTALAKSPDTKLHYLAPGMSKWPQIKTTVWIERGKSMPPTKDIPGLPSLLNKVEAAIPDLVSFQCRPASTEPVYRIMIEARETNTATLARYAQDLAIHIQQHVGRIGLPIQTLDCVLGGCISGAAS